MKSQKLQEMVKKIFSDEETKSQFLANPDSVISQFDLSATEKMAALSTHANLGLVTGNIPGLKAVVGPLDYWW